MSDSNARPGHDDETGTGRANRSTSHQMKFDNQSIQPILHDTKTTTARLHVEWQTIKKGDELTIQKENGEEVAVAKVDTAQTVGLQAALVVLNNRSGHKSYDSIHDLHSSLSEYYPDQHIEFQTGIRIIDFHVTDVVGGCDV